MKILNLIRDITDKILLLVLILSGLFLATSVLIYAYNCFLRYVVKSPWPWPEEYCTYIIVLMVFLMQCKLEFNEDSLSISVLWSRVQNKPILRRIMFTLEGVISIVITAVMFETGLGVVEQQFAYGVVTPVMHIPFGIYYALINLCFILVSIVWIINIFTRRFNNDIVKEVE